jgi:hypothetical protein
LDLPEKVCFRASLLLDPMEGSDGGRDTVA